MSDASLRSRVEVVLRLIDLAEGRGDGSDLASLRRRASSLLEPPAPPRNEAARVQALIDVEVSTWDDVFSEVLLPDRHQAFVEALRVDPWPGDGSQGPDPWAMVDARVPPASEVEVRAHILRAERAATAACRAYQRTREIRYLRDAVAHLGSAVEVMRRPLCAGVPLWACSQHADRLERALREALPASAFRFLVSGVRRFLEDEVFDVGAVRRDHDREPQHRLSRAEWTVRGPDEERAEGRWFINKIQQYYVDEMEDETLAEEADRSRQAEADERYRRWQAERDEEAEVEPPVDDLEPSPARAPAEPETSIVREEASDPVPPLTQVPEFDDRYNVAWPAHLEENARYLAEKSRDNEQDWAEYVQEGELLKANESERLRAAEETKRAEDAYRAKLALKASPARIQSRR